MDYKRELERLSCLPSISGAECAVQNYFLSLLKPFADSTQTDAVGNALAIRRCHRKNAPLLLLDAHMDEVGFLVTEHCGGGFLRVARVGGTDPAVLPASRLLFYGKECVEAVVAAKPPHLRREAEREKKQMTDELYVDTGLCEERSIELLTPGTPGGFADTLTTLSGNCVASRGLDNRVSGLVLCAVLEHFDPETALYDLAVLFSVQEEIGGPGAAAASFSLKPDLAFCVDVGFANFSGAEGTMLVRGAGPGVSFSDTLSRTLSQDLLRVAATENISVTVLAEPGETGTNAHEIQVTAAGIPAAVVSIPLSYMHTPSEVLDLEDLHQTEALLCAYLRGGKFFAKEVTLVG